jgi:hypothetical protein
LSAARWAADQARSPAQQSVPRPALSSPQKRRRGLADIIGGAVPAITAIRMVSGRRQWARIIAAIEPIGFVKSKAPQARGAKSISGEQVTLHEKRQRLLL